MNHLNAQKGLKRLHSAQVLMIVGVALACTVLLAIPGALVLAAAGIVELIGYINCSKDDDGYKLALYIVIAQIVLSLLDSVLGDFASPLSTLANVAATWFVIMTSVRLLDAGGQSEVAQQGRKTWGVYWKAQAINIAVTLLAAAVKANVLTVLLGIVGAVFGIISFISYMKFLKAAYPII